MATTLAEVLQHFGPDYLLAHGLSTEQARAWRAIRNYGRLAPAAKRRRLALAREPPSMPAANPQATEDAQASMRRVTAIEIDACPHCRQGRWHVVEVRQPDRAALAAISPAACRGPP